METLLVRLKAFDPRRGHVLRRYTYRGVKFDGAHGWYRVEKGVADYLRAVRQVDTDPHSPLAFEVATEADARRLDEEEAAQTRPTRATDEIPLAVPRSPAAGAVTTADLPDGALTGAIATEAPGLGRRGRKGQE